MKYHLIFAMVVLGVFLIGPCTKHEPPTLSISVVGLYPQMQEVDVILHILSKKNVKEKCGPIAGACWGFIKGRHHVWIESPSGPFDPRFNCFLFHELMHVELGNWHRGGKNSNCGPKFE